MTLSSKDRRAQIVQWVSFDGWANVNELARRFDISQVSIRRDLEELEKQGFLRRVRGGALPASNNLQGDIYDQRATSHVEEKQRIARAATVLIQPSDRIILDSGSTVAEMAKCIPTEVTLRQHLRIITGSMPVVQFLTPYPQIQLLVLGGIYLQQYRTVVGPQTLDSLHGLHVDKVFIGSDGVTIDAGISTANVLEAEVARATARAADTVIVVTDSSKIGHTGFATVMPLEKIHVLITDVGAPLDFVAQVRAMGVDVRVV